MYAQSSTLQTIVDSTNENLIDNTRIKFGTLHVLRTLVIWAAQRNAMKNAAVDVSFFRSLREEVARFCISMILWRLNRGKEE